MKGYSRSREDRREKLVRKYVENPVYTVTKNNMKELVLVTTKDCSRCHFIKPNLEKRCSENGYKFKEMEYGKGMDEITSVPCAMIGEDVILDYEGIIELLTTKKSFY